MTKTREKLTMIFLSTKLIHAQTEKQIIRTSSSNHNKISPLLLTNTNVVSTESLRSALLTEFLCFFQYERSISFSGLTLTQTLTLSLAQA